MGDAMRFIELRSEEASVANPRTGISSVTTGASSGWTEDFRKDVLGHLTDPELFDAAWHAIPRNRPSAVGLRIVSLGEGRSRAVADLALRLAEELDPNREPETGVELPERWELDKRLYPITPPYPTDPAYIAALPAPIRGLAAVKRGNPIAIASRTTSQYEDAVALGLGMLKSEPPACGHSLKALSAQNLMAPTLTRLAQQHWRLSFRAPCSETAWRANTQRKPMLLRGLVNCLIKPPTHKPMASPPLFLRTGSQVMQMQFAQMARALFLRGLKKSPNSGLSSHRQSLKLSQPLRRLARGFHGY
jgi:hypothetical protein